MKVYIYCLFNVEGVPFYIGKTKNNLLLREKQHKKRLNIDLNIFELDIVESDEWEFWENYWLCQFKQWGFDLINKNKGGGGPEFHSREVRKKMSSTSRPQTSLKLKGKKRPDVSKQRKGIKLTNKTKEKISESKKGHKCYNSERTEKIVNSNLKHYAQGSQRNKTISEKLTNRDCYWSFKNKKTVIKYDKDLNYIEEFDSISEASNSLNKNTASISECCHNKRKSAYGYIWKFKDKSNNN
jgi:hypothetical protein